MFHNKCPLILFRQQGFHDVRLLSRIYSLRTRMGQMSNFPAVISSSYSSSVGQRLTLLKSGFNYSGQRTNFSAGGLRSAKTSYGDCTVLSQRSNYSSKKGGLSTPKIYNFNSVCHRSSFASVLVSTDDIDISSSVSGRRSSFSSTPSTQKGQNSHSFITTPIFYVNAEPHIGHLYTSVIADAYHRYQKLRDLSNILGGESGDNVENKWILSTGTDEHGMKIEKAAKAAGLTKTLDHCDNVSSSFRHMCHEFGVDYTDFVRTTEDRHLEAVTHFWKRLEDAGHIYKSHYEGWYCLADEAFIPESMVTEKVTQKGEKVRISTESGHPVEWSSEENYMFKLTNFLPQITKWIKNENPIKPEKFGGIVLHWIEEGFTDLSVSRPSSRLSWGIPVPSDPSQVIYVWLDALVNYLTVAGYPHNQNMQWPPTLQIVGKDILKFHAIYWPAFLLAAGLKLPQEILCHCHWTVDDKKMSKSVGNVVNPFEMGEKYGTDGLRYFLLREGTPHSDANFTEEKMRRLLNAELADTFGNLLSRCSGKAVNPSQTWPHWDHDNSDNLLSDHGIALKSSLEELPEKVETSYNEFNFYRGLENIMTTIRLGNLYVEDTKPWALAKKSPNDPALQAMISLVFETLRVTAIMMLPIVPTLSSVVLDRLNVEMLDRTWSSLKPFVWEKNKQIGNQALGSQHDVFYRRVKQ